MNSGQCDKKFWFVAAARWLLLGLTIASVSVLSAAGPCVAGESRAEAAVQIAEEAGADIDEAVEAEKAVAGHTSEAAIAVEKAEEERKAKEERERQRREVIATAEEGVESIDRAFLDTLPASIGRVMGYRILNISLWRYAIGIGIVFAFYLCWLYLRRRFDAKLKDQAPSILGGWHLAMHVGLLALRRPVKILLAGITLKLFTFFFVTRFHPEFLWASNLLVYFAFIFYVYDLVSLIDRFYGQRIFHSPDRLFDTVRPLAIKAVKGLIILVALLHTYESVTGQTLVSIIAGLGIGGLALALASQETLKNLLGFASIAMDQPFLVGDSVVIGSDDGTVEMVGLRSMRIRKFDGSCVVVPNSTAISANVQNKTRRPYIRRNICLRLHPANGIDKVELALQSIREVLEDHKGAIEGKPPVVRFDEYEPARLVINAYFWFDPDSRFDYYDEAARVNLEIYRRLSEAGVVFAER